MNIKQKHSRSGDVNLRPTDKLPENLKIIEHNGSYITARGEATGSIHQLKVADPQKMKIMQDEKGNTYIQLLDVAEHSHTSDHETIKVMPGIYKQINEREIDHFNDSVVRRVVD
mgnify:CR=1 FL=1